VTRARSGVLVLSALVLSWGTAPAASGSSIVLEPDLATSHAAAPPSGGPLAHTASLGYSGGPVLHANRTHVIFWQPSGTTLTFDPGYVTVIEQFLTGVAADSRTLTNQYGLTGQYTDAGGPAAYASTDGGGVIDPGALPPSGCIEPILTGPGWATCVTDAQLQTELLRVIAADHLPHTPTDAYFIVTPNGLGSCEDSTSTSCALGGSATGYCGYHSATSSGILYAVIPYNAVPGHCQSTNPRPNASTADPTLSTLSHEHAEIVTDPLGNAWVDSSGSEIADLCITSYGPALGGTGSSRYDEVIEGHDYWLQELYSRITGGCEPRPRPDTVSIGLTGRGRSGLPLGLTGRAAMPGGAIGAYDWSFGDGRVGHGRSVSHTYARVGSERVTLRITDSAGNWAYATRTVKVTRGSARDRSHRRG
jgi:hypothetical protein